MVLGLPKGEKSNRVEKKRVRKKDKHFGKYINRYIKRNKTKISQRWQAVRRRTIKT